MSNYQWFTLAGGPILEINIKERNVEKANQIKKSTARLSIASNALLVVLKLIVGFSIGSVSIISEAIHSGIDLVAALIAYISVKKSSEPPDLEHRFGHGKFEDFSGVIEGVLIFVAALIIIYEAAMKLLGHGARHGNGLAFICRYRRHVRLSGRQLVCLQPAHESRQGDGFHSAGGGRLAPAHGHIHVVRNLRRPGDDQAHRMEVPGSCFRDPGRFIHNQSSVRPYKAGYFGSDGQ